MGGGMGTLVLLMCQALDLGVSPSEDLPRISDLEWTPRPPHEVEERVGADIFAVWTQFDTGLRLKDAWGYGGDFKIGMDWGKTVTLNFKLGYAGWDTDNDDQQTFSAKSKIRQYRFGVGGDFSTRWIDFGLYAITGLYHFHSRITNDTNGFFELQGSITFKPFPHLKVGITGMTSFVSTDFNRAATHLFTNQSIGPMVEVSF
jgi:hypothetical protein